MRIAVYCGSRDGNGPEYLAKAEELGRWIGKNGHELVYGGSQGGLMGAVADAALQCGAAVTGVQPDIPLIKARCHPGLTTLIQTKTMAERRSEMIRLSDAFVALPGGVGTLDEISEVLSLASLDIVQGPVVFVNTLGYYDRLRAFTQDMVERGFAEKEYFDRVLFSDDAEEIGRFLEKGRI